MDGQTGPMLNAVIHYQCAS